MRLIPEAVLAAVIAGVGIGVWLDPALSSALSLLLLAVAALAVAVGFRVVRVPAGPMLLAAALAFGVWRTETVGIESLPIIPTGTGTTVTVRITDAATSSGGRYRFRGQVVAESDGHAGSVPPGANLLIYALPPDEPVAERARPFLRHGDTLRLTGSVERPEPIGDFDYAAWLESQGIAGVMWARQAELVAAGGGSPAAGLHRVRSALASSIQRAVPEPESGLGQALLLGIRTELPHGVRDAFRTAGMSHLLAISGLHVGIVMALTLAAASAATGRNHPAAIGITALVVWGYAVLSGLDPPVVRAAIMGSLYLAQGLLGRGMRGLTALLLAGAVMVVIEPSLIASLSFQLSFTAMAGVILGLPVITALSAAVSAAASGGYAARWGGYGLSLLIASAVISTTTTLATLPLVAWHFGEIPLMSVPATMLAMPAMPAALLGTAVTSAVGLLLPPLGTALGTLAWAPLAWLIRVADAMPPAMLPAPWLTAPVAAGWLGCLGGLAMLASSRRVRVGVGGLRRRRAWRPAGMAGLLAGATPVAVIAALLLAGQLASARADGLLHVYVLDVGQGDAVFIVTPDGAQMLVDGGADSRITLGALSPLMPPGDRTLDVVAATHLDGDHVGGLLGVLDRYNAGVILQGADSSDEAALHPQWRAVLREADRPATRVHAGHRIQLGRDVSLDVLHPPADGGAAGFERNANNDSIVMRLDYGAVSFLLTGDIEVEAERHLATTARDRLRVDVLKVAHHGSRTSTSPGFLGVVNARSAAVSAGRDNQYGHPHPDVMERLESALDSSLVFLTARDGTVEYVSDGESLWVTTHGAGGRRGDAGGSRRQDLR